MQDQSYSSGKYFADVRRHSKDAEFKANNFVKLFASFAKANNLQITSYADVGCGSGDVVKIVADSLARNGFELAKVRGYDVSPHVQSVSNDGIEYVHSDFSTSNDFADLVTLFDVFEHIPGAIDYIKDVSQKCKIMGFHIPLDDSINIALRDMYQPKLRDPGHLIFMDVVSALNLLALAGLRVVEYRYTYGFLAPSGYETFISKLAVPIRYLLAHISPWLLGKTLGGVGLVVIALTPSGLQDIRP